MVMGFLIYLIWEHCLKFNKYWDTSNAINRLACMYALYMPSYCYDDFMDHHVAPVSYTHLDVYKRQI